jgi:hypothetical protein
MVDWRSETVGNLSHLCRIPGAVPQDSRTWDIGNHRLKPEGCGLQFSDQSRKTPMSPRIALNCYAAKTAAGAGLGSHGPGIGGINRAMSSDPQSPHRRPDDVETVSQFSQ